MRRELIHRIFTHIPVIETERLYLRRMQSTDSHDMYEYARLEDVTQYLLWNPHPSEDYTRRYLEYLDGRYRAGDFYDWAIILKAENKMIGTCGFTKICCDSDSAEIGYVLNPKYWNMGIAAEAAGAVMKFGFENLTLNRIEAHYMADNIASRKVMEKIGMTHEGVLRDFMKIKGRYEDIGICSILYAEYKMLFDQN